jgi:hypothetical protein
MKTATANLAKFASLPEMPKMHETENDISQERRSELNALMNRRLADAVDLQMQMKQAHWNVKGPSFIGLHELILPLKPFGFFVSIVAGRGSETNTSPREHNQRVSKRRPSTMNTTDHEILHLDHPIQLRN